MTISETQIETIGDCLEFGLMHNPEPLQELHRRNLTLVTSSASEAPEPTRPVDLIEIDSGQSLPSWPALAWAAFAAFAFFLALIAFWAWKDAGFPTTFPL